MRILLTGFGPFPGVPRNPSQSVVERFPDRLAGQEIHRVVLPTIYDKAGTTIETLLLETTPDICLCLGVAANDFLRLETVARNHGTVGIADQSGAVRTGPIAPDGPELYSCTLPFEAVHDALKLRGIAADLSDDAGGYVCNHVFYSARHAVTRHRLATACGFLHVPPVGTGDRESEDLDRLTGSVRTTVEILIEQIEMAQQPAPRR